MANKFYNLLLLLSLVVGAFVVYNYLKGNSVQSKKDSPNVLNRNEKDGILFNNPQFGDINARKVETSKQFLSKFVNVYSSKVIGYPTVAFKCGPKTIQMSIIEKSDHLSDLYRSGRTWEEDLTNGLVTLAKNQDFHFIDIGSNLGVHGLSMACRGYDVLAVDANIEYIKRLHETALRNNFSGQVVTVNNAVTDSHDIFGMKTAIDIQKLSGTNASGIRGIYMDDLIPLLKHKGIIMKIDIESGEIAAFRKSQSLFKNFTIIAIVIEWHWIKVKPEIKELITLFQANRLSPYLLNGQKLDVSTHLSWPINVVWKS